MNEETVLNLIGIFQELPLPAGYDFSEDREKIEVIIDQAIQAERERLVGEIEKQKEIQYENETKRQWYEKEGKNKMADSIINLINNK